MSSNDALNHVAVDDAGDVLGAGALSVLLPGPPYIDTRAVVTKHAGADGALRWQTLLGQPGAVNPAAPEGMAVDAAGDVVVAGRWSAANPGLLTFAVAKVAGATGTIAWERNLSGSAVDHAGADDVALAATGDVVAVGWATNVGTSFDVVAYKLDGETGATIWSRVIDGSATVSDYDQFRHVAVDAAGDVFVSGYFHDPTEVQKVMKLSGTTGADLWPAPVVVSFAAELAVEPGGDLVVVDLDASGSTVRKLSSADGSEVWQHAVAIAILSSRPVFAGDDPVLAGNVSGRFGVVKIDGATGGEVWTYLGALGAIAVGAGVDPNGGISAGGRIDHAETGTDFYAVRLDGITGVERATYRADGGTAKDDWADAFALAAGGQIVLGGWVAEGGNGYPVDLSDDIAVLRFDDRLAGKSITMLDQGAASRLLVRVKDPQLLASTPGAPGDPTVDGATLVVTNPATLETASFALPASLWKGIAGDEAGPRAVQVQRSDRIRRTVPHAEREERACLEGEVSGLARGFHARRAEPGRTARAAHARHRGGAYCLAFGGVRLDVAGQFKASSAPPPTSCI